jgi:hypothetical protein
MRWAVWIVNESRYLFPDEGPEPMMFTESEAFAVACKMTGNGTAARAVRFWRDS